MMVRDARKLESTLLKPAIVASHTLLLGDNFYTLTVSLILSEE